jgi:hypothetical protein
MRCSQKSPVLFHLAIDNPDSPYKDTDTRTEAGFSYRFLVHAPSMTATRWRIRHSTSSSMRLGRVPGGMGSSWGRIQGLSDTAFC